MNERTTFLQIRQSFEPGFGELVGADLLQQARQVRDEKPELAASVVLLRWQGLTPTSMIRVVHHPPGIEPPIALVAGRHTRCDLAGIPGASLRHALILLWPPRGEREMPFAEVIDLGTQTGLALLDGRLATRIAGSTPLRFGLAGADVVVLHARPGEPLSTDASTLSDLLSEMSDHSEVTSHGDLSQCGEPEGSCVVIPVGPDRSATYGTEHIMLTQVIRLAQDHVNARVTVRLQDLKRGVRLGRYQRCRGASVLGQDTQVSRVHALVLDRGGRRWLFDTASTNGTEVVDIESGVAVGPVRGERTFALLEGQAPSLAGQMALLDVGLPEVPS